MKIDVMIAGAQKAGTSSLKYYLQQHPEISSHINLECDYFVSEQADFDKYFVQYFETPNKVILAKYAGIYKQENFLKKLYIHNQNCKLIFILREPVDRLVSAYDMEKKAGPILLLMPLSRLLRITIMVSII